MHVLTDKLEFGIAHQHTRQQARLTQDLKSIAHAEHQPALLGVRPYRIHDWRARRDRAASQIVAVRKTAWQHHEIGPGWQSGVTVPHHRRLPPGDKAQRPRHVALAVYAR